MARTSNAKEGRSFSIFSGGAFMMDTRVGTSLCSNAVRDGPNDSSRNNSCDSEEIRGSALRERKRKIQLDEEGGSGEGEGRAAGD